MMQAVSGDTRTCDKLEKYIGLMAGGSRDALSSLYCETKSAVYGFALSILRSAEDAEDVLQEVYIRVWQAAGGYAPQGKPMAWLLTITKNLSASKLRERGHRAELSEEQWQMLYVESPAVTSEDRLVLSSALGGLGESERQVVMLHAVAGLKHGEIAALLGLPLSTVLSKYSRALVKLKHMLGEELK